MTVLSSFGNISTYEHSKKQLYKSKVIRKDFCKMNLSINKKSKYVPLVQETYTAFQDIVIIFFKSKN